MATLTYVYADSTVVIGPLATWAEPHSYDLCADHAARMTAPRGWELVRLASDLAPPETHDDLVALANVVRRANAEAKATEGHPAGSSAMDPLPAGTSVVAGSELRSASTRAEPSSVREAGRRGHLRILKDDSAD